MVRRIWITIPDRNPALLRSLRFEARWDGAAEPAVSAPLGDFFGVGLGRCVPFESEWFSSPEGRSFVCILPMPFRTGMRIEVANESAQSVPLFFYEVDYTLGDAIGDDALYLHAHWRRERRTGFQRDFEIVPAVSGRGRFLGANLGVIADRGRYLSSWWGEGEMKCWIDGDGDLPTLVGTGTEDWIGTGWGQGRFHHRWQGCPVAEPEAMRFCFYRYHGPDPVWFQRDLRVTIQQIGCWDPASKRAFAQQRTPPRAAAAGMPPLDFAAEGGLADYGLFEREDDWSGCAYLYLDRPGRALPPLAPVAERTADL